MFFESSEKKQLKAEARAHSKAAGERFRSFVSNDCGTAATREKGFLKAERQTEKRAYAEYMKKAKEAPKPLAKEALVPNRKKA